METYKKVMWGSIAAASIAAVFLIINFFFVGESTPSPTPPPARQEAAPTPLPTPTADEIGEEIDTAAAPALEIGINESDPVIREMLANCSSHPGFAKWLKNKDLIRTAAAVINNVANGESPAPHLDFLLPPEEFKVLEKNGKIYLDPRGYKRYDRAAAVFSSLDSAAVVSLYKQAKPLMEEAFKDLGFPRERFDFVLRRAITMLLQAPVIDTEIELEEKVTTYALADPALERLTPAQKHLLRMGPENIKKIQAKLIEIVSRL